MIGVKHHTYILILWGKTGGTASHSITRAENKNESLKISPVDLDKRNKDQSLAFKIVIKTLVDFSNKSKNYNPFE